MSEQQTCGKGIAARSPLPARLADVTEAMASVLAFHQKSLPLADDSAAAELRMYSRLEEQYRSVAAFLRSIAQTMAEARDLPMAPHDVKILGSTENRDAFAKFVEAERLLAEYLDRAISEDRAMLC